MHIHTTQADQELITLTAAQTLHDTVIGQAQGTEGYLQRW